MTREQELEREVRRLEAQVTYLKKIDSPEGGEALPNREKALAVAELSGQHDLADLLGAAGLARSTYHYALTHPKRPTRPEPRTRVAEIFGRLPTASATARWRWSCGPWTAPASRTRRCSR